MQINYVDLYARMFLWFWGQEEFFIAIKEKINKFNYIKIKDFCLPKKHYKANGKDKTTVWEKKFAKHITKN